MSTCKVHARPFDNEVLRSALSEIESIVSDFEMDIHHICCVLGNEKCKLTDDDSETAAVIDEIIYRLETVCETFVDVDPSKNFTRDLFNIAINGLDDEYEEDVYEEEEDSQDKEIA